MSTRREVEQVIHQDCFGSGAQDFCCTKVVLIESFWLGLGIDVPECRLRRVVVFVEG